MYIQTLLSLLVLAHRDAIAAETSASSASENQTGDDLGYCS